ncbi:MAG TPA: cupin domain-containing protein [Candidatus Saccharimonadales bacterium]|nr:cupin domain-containing protein [Candidatus Saccharimonadales bacterium]
MAKYKVVKTAEVENFSKNGEMRMMRDALGSDQVAISYRKFPAGFKSAHGHTHSTMDEVIFVIKGTITMKLDDDIIKVGPYTSVMIPPEVKRGYRNETDEDVELIVASARGSIVEDNGGTPDENWWE